MVLRSIQKVRDETAVLQQRCQARQAAGNADTTPDICDVFLRTNTAVEVHQEIMKAYTAVHGKDEDLEKDSAAANEAFEAVVELYFSLRTWIELAQDEWNLTQHSIRKHGLLGTLKNEVVEVGNDVADLSQTAADVARAGSTHVPRLVRTATGTVSNVVTSGAGAAASTAGGFAERSQRQIGSMIEDQVVTPVKRAWHLIVTAFLLCFLVPLFGLRTYAPLNSCVSNLGLVYAMVAICCPPRGIRRRAAKAALLVAYPLVTVALPLGLHYWATHPSMDGGRWPSWPDLKPLPLPRFSFNSAAGSAPAKVDTAEQKEDLQEGEGEVRKKSNPLEKLKTWMRKLRKPPPSETFVTVVRHVGRSALRGNSRGRVRKFEM